MLQIDDVLKRPSPDDRQKPPRRSVIHEPGQILGDAYRNTRAAPDLQFDDATVDGNIGRWSGSLRGRCWRGKRKENNGRSHDDPGFHNWPTLSGAAGLGKVLHSSNAEHQRHYL